MVERKGKIRSLVLTADGKACELFGLSVPSIAHQIAKFGSMLVKDIELEPKINPETKEAVFEVYQDKKSGEEIKKPLYLVKKISFFGKDEAKGKGVFVNLEAATFSYKTVIEKIDGGKVSKKEIDFTVVKNIKRDWTVDDKGNSRATITNLEDDKKNNNIGMTNLLMAVAYKHKDGEKAVEDGSLMLQVDTFENKEGKTIWFIKGAFAIGKKDKSEVAAAGTGSSDEDIPFEAPKEEKKGKGKK